MVGVNLLRAPRRSDSGKPTVLRTLCWVLAERAPTAVDSVSWTSCVVVRRAVEGAGLPVRGMCGSGSRVVGVAAASLDAVAKNGKR